MAMITETDPCPFCGLPFGDEEIIGFTYIGTADPLLRRVDDWAAHRCCLELFPQRFELIAAWNAEAGRRLGRRWMLKITPAGEVSRLSWWDWWLYRRGFKARLTRRHT
jgi:hypothetical protein